MTVLVNVETLATLTLSEVKARIPGWAPPEPPSPESLEGSGWALLESAPQPLGDFIPGEVREEDGRYVRGWIPLDLSAEQWADRIAARRYTAETSGTVIAGMPIDTDDRSKTLINGAALRAYRNTDYVLRWKTSDGFVDLPAAQVLAIADAVSEHVQLCFDREDALLGAVADGSITAEMLEEGWPS